MDSKIAVFDVETPNRRNDSICSIGITYVDDSGTIREYYSLVNPECSFDDVNISIHGITPVMIADAPTFSQLWQSIENIFSEYLLCGHNVKFDLSCIKKSLGRCNIRAVDPYYIDTLEISKSVFPKLDSYNLASMCSMFGIDSGAHHNAIDDCRATFNLLRALSCRTDYADYIHQYDFSDIEKRVRGKRFDYSDTTKYLQELKGFLTGVMCDNILTNDVIFGLKYWADTHNALRGNYPFDKVYDALDAVLEDNIITEDERDYLFSIFQSVINPLESSSPCVIDCDFEGKQICLTGEFEEIERKDLERMLDHCGAIVKQSVTKRLDYLIVGGLGSERWAQGNYGSKIKKAMEYNEKGADIAIIREADFLEVFDPIP